MAEEYFILSLKWTRGADRSIGKRSDPYVTFWGPDNGGYRWALSEAGRYTADQVSANLSYYDNGFDTLAVPCDVVMGMATEGSDRHMDRRSDMRVVAHTPANMKALRAASLRAYRLKEAA